MDSFQLRRVIHKIIADPELNEVKILCMEGDLLCLLNCWYLLTEQFD